MLELQPFVDKYHEHVPWLLAVCVNYSDFLLLAEQQIINCKAVATNWYNP